MNNYQYHNVENLNGYELGLHPSVKIGKNLVIGENVIIEENVVIGSDCFIGHHCLIRPGSVIGDRVSIRSFCLLDPEVVLCNDIAIYPHATVGGGTIIEDKVYYGPYSLTTNCDAIRFHRLPVDYNIIKPPVIKTGAIIAAGCMIKPGVIIGRNSVLGMGSVLTKDIPDNEIWFGNPAIHRDDVRPGDRIIGEEMVDIGKEAYVGFPESVLGFHEDLNEANGVNNE